MLQKRQFVPFDFRILTRPVPIEEGNKEGGGDDFSDAINLKKVFKIPGLFLKADPKK